MRQDENTHAWIDSGSMNSIKINYGFQYQFYSIWSNNLKKIKTQLTIITKLNKIRIVVLHH